MKNEPALRRERCKCCGAPMLGDWLSTIDGEFCNHACCTQWQAGQYKLNRRFIELLNRVKRFFSRDQQRAELESSQ